MTRHRAPCSFASARTRITYPSALPLMVRAETMRRKPFFT